MTLRYGGARTEYTRINSSLPSIWQYTAYIDAQRTGSNLQNLMTDLERKDIDEFAQFDQTGVGCSEKCEQKHYH